jgi:predicted dehydrogenase
MALAVTIAGLGTRGREWVQAVRTAPGVELAACVETDEVRLQKSAQALALPAGRCFRSLDEALHTVSCQAVIVATSMNRHV